jgi:hypothetical protein
VTDINQLFKTVEAAKILQMQQTAEVLNDMSYVIIPFD